MMQSYLSVSNVHNLWTQGKLIREAKTSRKSCLSAFSGKKIKNNKIKNKNKKSPQSLKSISFGSWISCWTWRIRHTIPLHFSQLMFSKLPDIDSEKVSSSKHQSITFKWTRIKVKLLGMPRFMSHMGRNAVTTNIFVKETAWRLVGSHWKVHSPEGNSSVTVSFQTAELHAFVPGNQANLV